MPGNSIRIKLDGFEQLKDMVDPAKFKKRMKDKVRKATELNALLAEGRIKEDISEGKFKPNAGMTAALKSGASKPLVAGGDLFANIKGVANTWRSAVIGILRSKAVKDKDGNTRDLLNVAKILHYGATVGVTPKMRRYFFALARENPNVKPLKESTQAIIIPARPFLEGATSDKMVAKYKHNWEQAIQRAMAGKKR